MEYHFPTSPKLPDGIEPSYRPYRGRILPIELQERTESSVPESNRLIRFTGPAHRQQCLRSDQRKLCLGVEPSSMAYGAIASPSMLTEQVPVAGFEPTSFSLEASRLIRSATRAYWGDRRDSNSLTSGSQPLRAPGCVRPQATGETRTRILEFRKLLPCPVGPRRQKAPVLGFEPRVAVLEAAGLAVNRHRNKNVACGSRTRIVWLRTRQPKPLAERDK